MTPPQTPFNYEVEKLPTKVKGIDPKVVQLILEEGRDEWQKIEQRVAELGDKVARYEEERSSVNSALIVAQKSGEDLVIQAQNRADVIISEARASSAALADEHRAALRDLQQDLEQMTLTKQKFADDFRALLKGYLAELDARFPVSTVRPAEVIESESEPDFSEVSADTVTEEGAATISEPIPE